MPPDQTSPSRSSPTGRPHARQFLAGAGVATALAAVLAYLVGTVTWGDGAGVSPVDGRWGAEALIVGTLPPTAFAALVVAGARLRRRRMLVADLGPVVAAHALVATLVALGLSTLAHSMLWWSIWAGIHSLVWAVGSGWVVLQSAAAFAVLRWLFPRAP